MSLQNFEDYAKTQWVPTMPITANRMNKIETGVYENREAIQQLDSVLDQQISNLQGISSAIGNLNNYSATNTLVSYINSLPTTQYVTQEIDRIAGRGNDAWNNIVGLLTLDQSGTPTQLLSEVLQGMFSAVDGDLEDAVDTLDGKIKAIKDTLGTTINNNEVTYVYDTTHTVASAIKELHDILGYVSGDPVFTTTTSNTVGYRVKQLETAISNAAGVGSLYQRLKDIEDKADAGITAAQNADDKAQGVKEEVIQAHKQTGVDNEDQPVYQYNNLNERFTANEGILAEVTDAHRQNVANDTLAGRFSADEDLIAAKLNTADIVNDLNTSDLTTGKALDARQGRVIKEMLYSASQTAFTNADTVAGRISSINDLIGNAGTAGFGSQHTIVDTLKEVDDAHRTNLGTDPQTNEPIVDTLDKRFYDVEDRVDDVEDILDGVLVSSTIRTPGANDGDPDTDTTYSTLDARLEAIETSAVDARTDINVIANELGMMTQAGAIEDTNTKVDRLNDNVLALGKEIGMLSEETTLLPLANAIDRTSTDIDALKTEVGNAHRTNNDTLDMRFDDVEYAISHDATQNDNTTGLTEHMTVLENIVSGTNGVTSRLDAIDNASTGALKSLNDRIDTISSSVGTPTVIITQDKIAYDEETGLPTIYTSSTHTQQTIDNTITEDKDYILQNGNKYYYWKYIKVSTSPIRYEWKKISGDSDNTGSGAGNTSSYDLSEEAYDELGTYEVNADYYVTKSDGVHHYRYVMIEDADTHEEVLTEIEIGNTIDKANIKKYNMETYQKSGSNTTYLRLFEYDYGTSNAINDDVAALDAWEANTSYAINNKVIYNGYVYQCIQANTDEEWTPAKWQLDPTASHIRTLATIQLPEGGGGEVTSGYRMYGRVVGDTIIRASKTEVENTPIVVRFGFTCYDAANESYLPATYTLTKNDGTVIAASEDIVSSLTKTEYDNGGYNSDLSFEIHAEDCEVNKTNIFTLTLTSQLPSGELKTKPITVYITIVQLELSSTFSDAEPLAISNPIEIPYKFKGIAGQEQIFHVLFDNNEATFNINNGNIIIAPNYLSNKIGQHTLEIYVTQISNGETVPSNHLYYNIGLINSSDDSQNISMLFSSASLSPLTINQYKLMNIPYSLYLAPADGTSERITSTLVQLNYNNEHELISSDVISSRTESLSSGTHTYPFRINEMYYAKQYYYTLTISGTHTNTLTFNIIVNQATDSINIKPNNLVFNFDPSSQNFSNNMELEQRLWHDSTNTYKMRIPEGTYFDWTTGGWKTVDDIPCFCVKAGSRVEFIKEVNNVISPLTLFWDGMETNGSDFKCTFKIDNVKTPTAKFLTSLDSVNHDITQYGNWIESKYQDTDDADSLLSSYLNVKTNYIYYYNIDKLDNNINIETDINGKGAHDSKIGTTVLYDEALIEDIRQADLAAADAKNKKQIKEYIHNIYTIITHIDNEAGYNDRKFKDFLIGLLQGNEPLQEEEEDKDPVEEAIIRNLMHCNAQGIAENATNVYKNLMGTASGESAEDIALMAAYRNSNADGFNAITNGFVVEGKEKKDGIIAKLQFVIRARTKTFTPMGDTAIQTVSESYISHNPPAGTETYRVELTFTNENNVSETKVYEVVKTKVLDDNKNILWWQVTAIRDATRVIPHQYGLELNASGSYMYLPIGTLAYAHSEGDIIEFEYNINGALKNHIDSSIIIYEDGVPSAATIYTRNTDTYDKSVFYQSAPNSLIVGSDECDVYIYKMRLYDKALTNQEILKNFYADGLTDDEMSNRYDRNSALVNAAEITPDLVAENCPDLRVIMIEAPRLTGGKTSFIKDTKVRCIYKNGRPEDNWVALNAYHAGQGTSSDNYGAAGRNLDIMFGFDGIDPLIVEKPNKNNYSFDKTYKSILIKGINNELAANKNTILDSATYAAQSDEYTITTDGSGLVSINPDSIPNNWFNIKLNIASSENANNAYLQSRYDRFLRHLYTTPAQERNEHIKNDMEFVNCVVFIKETGDAKEFTEDNAITNPADRPWHFYGIGNLGDSKKTDKTRVNIPGDPKEFCVELSDNGLKNSEFSTGIFYTPMNIEDIIPEHVSALSAQVAYICEDGDYTYNQADDIYTFNIDSPSTTKLYLVKETKSKYTQYRRFMYIDSQFVEIGRPISFENLDEGIRYPVSVAEWTCSLNTYKEQLHKKTINSNGIVDRAKGWDKSFEFRYDLTTKDGETIERSEPEKILNNSRQEVNKQVFIDLYEWIVTATDDEFKTELKDWFIEDSPLFWYLFTERYTMIDSRAKNTFYHYGKVYISDDEYNGTNLDTLLAEKNAAQSAFEAVTENDPNYSELQIAYETALTNYNTADFIKKNRDTFRHDNTLANAAHHYGYRFDLWDYDNDTALGINNNGQMVFDAGLEDVDKTVGGSWVYNAAESVFWCRIRDNMYDKMCIIYQTLKTTGCFDDTSLIAEWDQKQAEFPEELWRLDFERKYFRPYKDSGETTYLSSMANGRKKYQRRQFERNMAIYICSKYLPKASYIDADQISFRPDITTIEDKDAIVVTPYSTMYINYMIGNTPEDSETGHVRVKANKAYPIYVKPYADRLQNFQCIIYNACRISKLEGIDKFECLWFSFSNAKKLSVLKLGGTNPNNKVTNIGQLGLNGDIPLLEELDISNIHFNDAPKELSLVNFPLLKKFNAQGSNIQHFIFKDGGLLKEIKYFPGDMDQIIFNNLYKLDTVEFEDQADLSKIKTYISTNSYPYSWDIVQNMLANNLNHDIVTLQLNDIDWEIEDINELEDLENLQEELGSNMYLAGHIKVTGEWSDPELEHYRDDVWHNQIEFDTSEGTKTYKCVVTYIESAFNGVPEHQIDQIFIDKGDSAGVPDIYFGKPLSELPKRNPTKDKQYQFGLRSNGYVRYSGWATSPDALNPLSTQFNINNPYPCNEDEITLYTWYKESEHEYTVKWYLNQGDTVPVQTAEGQKHGKGETLRAPTIQYLREHNYDTARVEWNTEDNTVSYYIFKGWQKLPTNIDPTTDEEVITSVYNIYGNWESHEHVPINDGTPNSLFYDITNLSLDQLLVLSRMTADRMTQYNLNVNMFKLKKLVYYAGYEGIISGTQLLTTPEIFKGDLNYALSQQLKINNTPIRPFADNNGFTIVLDYKFDDSMVETTKPSVLMGCYAKDDTGTSYTGFALCHNRDQEGNDTGVILKYGNINGTNATFQLNVGNAKDRNILVIRHPKDSTSLAVYSAKIAAVNLDPTDTFIGSEMTNTTVYEDSIDFQTFVPNSDATICIGALRHDVRWIAGTGETNARYNTERNSVINGQGIIYNVTYWNEDLGHGECMQLATWPRERMTAIIADVNPLASNSSTLPAIYLTTLNASMHGIYAPRNSVFGKATSQGSPVIKGWTNLGLKDICDNKIFNGLPIKLQSILHLTPIGYTNYINEVVLGETYEEENSARLEQQTTEGYIYIPSASSYDNTEFNSSIYKVESIYENTGDSLANTSDITPYSWIGDTSSVVVLKNYKANDGTWTETSDCAYYHNLRFELPITWSTSSKMRIYEVNFTNAFTERPFINMISGIQEGSIVIDIRYNEAYMYLTNDTISRYGLKTEIGDNASSKVYTDGSEGAWIKSVPYVTRSVNNSGNVNAGKDGMVFIDNIGTPQGIGNGGFSVPSRFNLVYSFTI